MSDDLAVACFKDEVEFSVGGFFLFEFLFVSAIFSDRGDSVFGAFFIFVALRLHDDFAVTCFETEVELAGFFALEEFVHIFLELMDKRNQIWRFVREKFFGGG